MNKPVNPSIRAMAEVNDDHFDHHEESDPIPPPSLNPSTIGVKMPEVLINLTLADLFFGDAYENTTSTKIARGVTPHFIWKLCSEGVCEEASNGIYNPIKKGDFENRRFQRTFTRS